MDSTGSYTIDELVEATGFDKRTIAYYVQEGLLPRIGRRGRLTRYPRVFADRLRVIKRLREAEESGERPFPLTLAEIREVFERLPVKELHAIATGLLPIGLIDRYSGPREEDLDGILPPPPDDPVRSAIEAPPDLASREDRMRLMLEETGEPDLFVPSRSSLPMDVEVPLDDSHDGPQIHRKMRFTSPAENVDACSGPPPDERNESARLAELLGDLARATVPESRGSGRSEDWTNASIAPGLNLSGRELGESDKRLLERAARLLRKLTTGEGR